MTSAASIDKKEVIFINERCRKDYEALPDDVREAADQALHVLQNGEQLPAKMVSQLKGSLAGADEVKIPYDSDTYRVYVDQGSQWVVMVLGAGMKKSPTGKEMPKTDKEMLETRLSKSKKYLKDEEKQIKAEFEKRAEARLQHTQKTSKEG